MRNDRPVDLVRRLCVVALADSLSGQRRTGCGECASLLRRVPESAKLKVVAAWRTSQVSDEFSQLFIRNFTHLLAAHEIDFYYYTGPQPTEISIR